VVAKTNIVAYTNKEKHYALTSNCKAFVLIIYMSWARMIPVKIMSHVIIFQVRELKIGL
jgi:hypothetical protein